MSLASMSKGRCQPGIESQIGWEVRWPGGVVPGVAIGEPKGSPSWLRAVGHGGCSGAAMQLIISRLGHDDVDPRSLGIRPSVPSGWIVVGHDRATSQEADR